MNYSSLEMFCKTGVLKNFAKFTGKNVCQSLFLIKLQGEACKFIKKENLAEVFPCEFCEIFKSNFLQYISGGWLISSGSCNLVILLVTILKKYRNERAITNLRFTIAIKSTFSCFDSLDQSPMFKLFFLYDNLMVSLLSVVMPSIFLKFLLLLFESQNFLSVSFPR